jgi:hypothetical protein
MFVRRALLGCQKKYAAPWPRCFGPALRIAVHFLPSGRLTITACITSERVCRVRRCSFLHFCRPDEASQSVLLTAFIVISMAVPTRLVHLVASANIMFECSGTSHKVRWRIPLKLPVLRSMQCCSLLCYATRAAGPRPPAASTPRKEKVDRSRACWLTWLVCFSAPSELAGRFLVADKESLARERRCPSEIARSGRTIIVWTAITPV